MRIEEVRNYLQELLKVNIPEWVCVFGGETLLFPDLLFSVIREVKKFKVSRVSVITNGFWGENEEIARKYARNMKKAGLDKLIVSVDAFHQEFIRLKTIKTVLQAAKDARIENIEIDAKVLGALEEDNVFNERTKALLKEIRGDFNVDIDIKPVSLCGRAAYTLARYLPSKGIPKERCSSLHYYGSLREPTGIEIEPNGWVWICAGVAIGNAKTDALSRILQRYDSEKNPIIRILVDEGPAGLLKLATEKGYKPLKGYADKCHLCFRVRSFLRPYFPEILVVDNCYSE
jgi:MoaA/NifB/PqqE/SkfB family radical SAM enzyme